MAQFDFLSVSFFTQSAVYPGSIGTFRYRFVPEGTPRTSAEQPESDIGSVTAYVYENVCFEEAREAETLTVPWEAAGVETLRAWLEERLAQRGAQPYRIPYPPKQAGDPPAP